MSCSPSDVVPCPLPFRYEDLPPTPGGRACPACRTEVVDRARSSAPAACVRVVHDRFLRPWTTEDRAVRLVAALAANRADHLLAAAGALVRLRPAWREPLRVFVGLVLARQRADRSARRGGADVDTPGSTGPALERMVEGCEPYLYKS